MGLFHKLRKKFKKQYFLLSQRLLNYPKESEIFLEKHGYPLNLKDPRSFNEKIIWRKIYDRNPLFPIITDKLKVRDYIRERLGEEQAKELLIPLLFHCSDPETIPFDDLPAQFVIKPSHASAKIIIVRDKTEINWGEILAECKNWLSKPYGFYDLEWAYQKLKPEILVEKLLLDEEGRIPMDYKFHVFHGKCKRIAVCSERFTGGRRVTAFDENWNYSDVVTNDPGGVYIPMPENFPSMLSLAEKLGGDFDYIRVDLYNIQGRIFFGELTVYPTSGHGAYSPTEFDFELGANWKLTPKTKKDPGKLMGSLIRRDDDGC